MLEWIPAWPGGLGRDNIVDDLVCRVLAYTQMIKSSILISIKFFVHNLGWKLDMPSVRL